MTTMKKFISFVVLLVIAQISIAQDYENVRLVFNDSLSNSSIYNLQNILDTDTLKTNNPNLTITSFVCSSICYVDWEVKHSSNILSNMAKKYIKSCAKNNSKLYFDNIMAINREGRVISLGNRVIRVKKVK